MRKIRKSETSGGIASCSDGEKVIVLEYKQAYKAACFLAPYDKGHETVENLKRGSGQGERGPGGDCRGGRVAAAGPVCGVRAAPTPKWPLII